jgi:hypothetical protein
MKKWERRTVEEEGDTVVAIENEDPEIGED